MAGLLSGLAGLGLDELENVDIYKSEEREKKEKEVPVQKAEEKDLIYEKTFQCPVCEESFPAKIMKSGKAKLIKTDQDLRPQHEGIDAAKYDVLLCPHCGYATLSRYFNSVVNTQAKLIKENISSRVQLRPYTGETYSYDEAVERYKLALANAVVKRAKPSEKAFICLKSAWLLRGYAESLEQEANPDSGKIAELRKQELDYLENAYNGFVEAIQSENFPMCGMDEITVDYLIAVLAARFKKYDVASRLVASILTSATANNRTKDKARELKEQILADIKKK